MLDCSFSHPVQKISSVVAKPLLDFSISSRGSLLQVLQYPKYASTVLFNSSKSITLFAHPDIFPSIVDCGAELVSDEIVVIDDTG